MNLNYDDVKKRILDEMSKNNGLGEFIENMETPLSGENYNYLLKLIYGDNFDSSGVEKKELIGNLYELRVHGLVDDYSSNSEDITDLLEIIDNKLDAHFSTLDAPEPTDDPKEDDLDDEPEDLDDEPEDLEPDEIEELEEVLEIKYDELINKLLSSDITETELDEMISALNAGTLDFEKYSQLLLNINNDDNFEPNKVDSEDFAQFIRTVKSDFSQIKQQVEQNLQENQEESPEEQDDESDELDDDEQEKEDIKSGVRLIGKWCELFDALYEPIKECEDHKLGSEQAKYKIKYISSEFKEKPKFNFGALSPKNFLLAMKNYGKYAVMGAGVGLIGAALIPTSSFIGGATGVITFARLAYSTGKFANKMISKVFLGGQPTPVDKVITTVKENIKNIETVRMVKNDPDGEIEEVRIKFKDSRLYKGIKKVNDFLKKPQVQWFINGMSLGYRIGDALNLNENIQKLFQPKQPTTTVTVPNTNTNLETSAPETTVPETTVPETTVPETTIPQEIVTKPSKPIINKPSATPETLIDGIGTSKPTIDVPETPNYSFLDNLDTGDNIDLSGVTEGFYDSYAARANEGAVNLISKYASADCGTFIKELRLADGSVFTGNIGDLLDSGIDPSKVAARIANNNGDYAWLNLEDIVNDLAKNAVKAKIRK